MKILIIALGLTLLAGPSGARADSRIITAHSSSGQFTALERQPFALTEPPAPIQTSALGSPAFLLPPRLASGATNLDSLTLEPAVLVVSCGRVREKFLADLGLPSAWRAPIELLINRNLPADAMPKLAALRGRQSWSYKLELPKTIQPQSLVRVLVGALLLEEANRAGGAQSAEVPLWLVEGFSAHLLANSLPTFLLQPGQRHPDDRFVLEGQTRIRRLLRDRAPLTFQQLSWPDALPTPEDKAFFRACSQLFVEELLALKDGRPSLRLMISQLGRNLNWQSAFLSAFHADFPSLLAVEKWWTVSGVNFRAADTGEYASSAEVWRRLQDTLDVPVRVRLNSASVPSEARITLQEAVNKWDGADAETVVQHAILRLQLQRYRSTPQLQPLVDSYLAALTSYLQAQRDLQRKHDSVKNLSSQLAVLKRSVCKQLDALDAQRDKMRATVLLTKNKP